MRQLNSFIYIVLSSFLYSEDVRVIIRSDMGVYLDGKRNLWENKKGYALF